MKKSIVFLLLLTMALAAAARELPLRAGTPVFDRPEGGAVPVMVLAQDVVAEAADDSRQDVFWSRHPLARRCETWRVTLPGGATGFVSPSLTVQDGAVVFAGQPPPVAVRIAGWLAAAGLAVLAGSFLSRREWSALAADWRLAGCAVLVRVLLLAWVVAGAQNLLCSAADEPGYFQVGYDLLHGDFSHQWTYPVGHGVLFYLPLIALTGAQEFNDISFLSSFVSGFLIAPGTLLTVFFVLRHLGMGRRTAGAAVLMWAVLPFFYHHCPDWSNRIFSALWGMPKTGMGFFHYMTLIGTGYTGMSDPLSTALVMLAILAALLPGSLPRKIWLTAGIFGIASLVRLNNIFMAPLLAFLILRQARQPGAAWWGFRPAAGYLLTGMAIYLGVVSIQLAVNRWQFGSLWTFPYVLHAVDLAPGDRPVDGFTMHTLLKGINLRYLLESNFAVMLAGLTALLLLPGRYQRTALALWALPMILFFGGYSHTFCDPVRFIAVAFPALLAGVAVFMAENGAGQRGTLPVTVAAVWLLLIGVPARCGGLPLPHWGIVQLMPGAALAEIGPLLPPLAIAGWSLHRRRGGLLAAVWIVLLCLGMLWADGTVLYLLAGALLLRALMDAGREIARPGC